MNVLTNHRENDHEDPAELDGRANDFDFTEDVDTKDVDSDDDSPEDGDPSSDRDLVCPEAKNRTYGLQLVCDGNHVREPVGPSERESCRGVDEFTSLLALCE